MKTLNVTEVARNSSALGQSVPDAAGDPAAYITDFDDFQAMNAVYREYFPADPPTRATVGVTRLALDAKIEIEVIATR